MAEVSAKQVQAGIALYSRVFLAVYDWLALGFSCRLIWKCPVRHMLQLYNEHVSDNHLDIGVATGYFMDHCQFPVANPSLALMDLSPNSLRVAGKRLSRYQPEVHQRNVLEPFEIDAPPFDSVGIMNLLHCLPGDLKSKGVVFENIKRVLATGGTAFGSTILTRGIKRNLIATLVLKKINRWGFMSNGDDDIASLQELLHRHFSESSVRVIGYEALFWARK